MVSGTAAAAAAGVVAMTAVVGDVVAATWGRFYETVSA
jgi:hypothetical protein